jgi:hypothetical protein
MTIHFKKSPILIINNKGSFEHKTIDILLFTDSFTIYLRLFEFICKFNLTFIEIFLNC